MCKLTVIFGKEACAYADGHGIKKAISEIDSGRIYGGYCHYETETEHDMDVVKKALSDSNGWEDFFWEE